MKNFTKPDYLKSEYNKINNLFLSGKFDKVIEKSKKIIEKNPTQIPFYNFLALSYREKGKIFLAEKILLNALKISPNNQSVLINLGSTYRVLIEFDKSEKFLKKAIQLMPNDPIVNDHYGDVLWKLNRKIQAKYYWQSALNSKESEEEMKKNISKKLLKGLIES